MFALFKASSIQKICERALVGTYDTLTARAVVKKNCLSVLFAFVQQTSCSCLHFELLSYRIVTML